MGKTAHYYICAMQFKDTSTKLGLIEACETTLFGDGGYGQISGNTNRLYQFTALLNRAQDRFVHLAVTADGRWQYDDTNNTDYPIATTNLVLDQQDYPLAVSHLYTMRVEVLDEDGNATELIPIDQNELKGVALTEFLATSGKPKYYDKVANSFFLYPKPSYNYTAGLKIYFQRGANYFVYTDTTKEPGFSSIHHPYLYRFACLEYALTHDMPIANKLAELVVRDEEAIKEFYAKRGKDEKPIIKPRHTSYN